MDTLQVINTLPYAVCFSRPCEVLKTRLSILSHFTGSLSINISIYVYDTYNGSNSWRNVGRHNAMCLFVKQVKTWHGPGQPCLGDIALSRDLDYVISIGARQPQLFCDSAGKKKNPSGSSTSSRSCTTQYFPNSNPWRNTVLIPFKVG